MHAPAPVRGAAHGRQTAARFLLCLAVIAATAGPTRSPLFAREVEQWGVFELPLTGPAAAQPYLDVHLSATFTQAGRQFSVPGFWDGGRSYKIRFSPPSPGEWQYRTHSSATEMEGQSGTFNVTAPGAANHGPVEVFNTFYLRFADGTPYHSFGTTCYAWTHQPQAMQEHTLKTLAASPFNKLRFCVFPKSYVYNKNEPELFAFQKGVDGKFDFSRPDPAFWRHFEQRILDLQKLGIEADLILWHPYDRWGFADMSKAEDDRYLRYCIARLSAFRNVWWSLANEYDFMTERPPGHRGNKQWEDWDRFFGILQKEDPHQRLRGIHNGGKWYDHTKPWVTHASLQTSDMNGGIRFRGQYRKPVVYDECRYEGDVPEGWGNLTAREMTQRFWLGTLQGCYVGHGETYRDPQDLLWWAKGGVLRGKSPPRIQWLKDFMARLPPFHELTPQGDAQGRFLLAKPGAAYLLYCLDDRSQSLQLAGERPYKVDLVDPWEMTVTALGTAPPGEYRFAAPKADLAFLFTPYGPGEKLRPEATITASATEGTPPLTVRFASTGGVRSRWDFGDGTASDDSHPEHTFQQPGLYFVTLTTYDPDGASSKAFQRIAVDRPSREPLLRVGFPSGEIPAPRFHGTARRGEEGILHLPEGAPWGWVQAGDGPLDDLRGLRSFTLMGWVRPESLQVGSGGNRILFCLNHHHSGIDLVCQPDGSLRLAVNEWPDGIRNDSSPGKLQVGRWTRFAVSCDLSGAQENVAWYFSPPMEVRTPSPLALDRKTSYRADPIGQDVGPLTIGNFNSTMRDYGLDRQFRGQIQGLELFGSRVSGRGALSAEEIRARSPSAPAEPAASAPPARWRPQTTDWSAATKLQVGDWGFNRPGYPEGLYVHGITRPAGEPISNPVIYDNDVYDDVFDDELAYVMASEGEMTLVGLIVTPVLTDFWGFSKPDWIQTAHESRHNAELSGLRMDRIPPITVGTEAPNEKAGENQDSAGARLYVQLINEQFARDPQRPMIVNLGGQGATLASAYGLDPSIAHKCIVYYTDLRVYNGHYQWASKLIAANFRVVSWGDDHWWITKPAQNQWRVLPRPENAEGKENDVNSGEWRQLTEMRVPLLDHLVKQFQTRGEYCQGPRKADGYLDGTFLHAWLPGLFGDAQLMTIRGGEVLHVTRFTSVNEDRAKAFANARLLNPQAYQRALDAAPGNRSVDVPANPTLRHVRVTMKTNVVDVYDFVEVTLQPEPIPGGNPFIDTVVEGEFAPTTGGPALKVDGFCDSPDGSVHRVRFMPSQPGEYRYQVRLRHGGQVQSQEGAFTAQRAHRPGILRVDPKHPFHFIWEGTGEHYFWNGTTAYYLMGWQSDEAIERVIDRLSELKVNRIRVLLYGRNEDRPWGTPIRSTPEFKLHLNPWVAQRPDHVKDPGFDLSRFNVAYWQRYERMLAYARQKGMVVSVIPFIAGQVFVTPYAANSQEEQLYYRYAVARLAPFSNLTWDLGNEHDLHWKAPEWADYMGPLVKQWDPYDHLTSVHNRIYRSPGNPWNDLQLVQRWDPGEQQEFFIEQRRQQAASGRIIPLINEEYGYEDLWEKKPGDRNADSRRRCAWEICMAGAYQTTGETANRGTGFPPDTGGGWVNGRGDPTMTLLRGNAHLVDFFTSFDWWRAEPRNDVVPAPAMCLAETGEVYAVYLPQSRRVRVTLPGGLSYRARWFNPRTGEWTKLPDASGPVWESPEPPSEGDWALLLTTYDWTTREWKSYFNHDGLQFNNNRWAGERGSLRVRLGPPTASWWTTHRGDRPDFPVSAPWVGVGSDWGNVSSHSPFPIKLSELEVLKASLSATVPRGKTNQMFKIYWQLYFSDDPKGTFNRGDFAPTVYGVNIPSNHWGTVRGSTVVDGRTWRFADQGLSSGMGRFIIPMLEPPLTPDDNGVVEIRDVDIKALIDWCIAQGLYRAEDYCLVILAGWEVWVQDDILRMNDMAFTIKQKGRPAVTLPVWTTLMETRATR